MNEEEFSCAIANTWVLPSDIRRPIIPVIFDEPISIAATKASFCVIADIY